MALGLVADREVERLAQEGHDLSEVRCGPDESDVRDTLAAGADLDEERPGRLAAQVDHHAKRFPHDSQVSEDARRPEESVPIASDDLDLTAGLERLCDSTVT